ETDDEVLHFLAAPLVEDAVTGAIDDVRRFDLMQQHTGQHILSQAFIHTAGAETVSFHLNPDPDQGALTIDLNQAALTPRQLERAEEFANTIVYENRPIRARFVSAEEVQALPLRKPPKVNKAIRIVEIQEFDWSACGGTHVARTGEVGLIKIVKLEKRGAETRVEFRCGRRALTDYGRKHALINQVASDLTIGFWELDQAIGRMQAEAKAVRKQLAEAEARLQQYEARELLNSIEPCGDYGLIVQTWLQRDAPYLKRMASLLVAQPKTVALLGATGQSLALVFARSKDLSIDLAALLKTAAARLGGKGGGSPDFAQAGGPAVSEEQLKDALSWTREQLL
ncbi:MAG TPA: DHHA1 domain-containing protein, partial [Anaerolineae bacterium]|nr:DHHA1 domain-containing protein [Anaerolineae bacterium]